MKERRSGNLYRRAVGLHYGADVNGAVPTIVVKGEYFSADDVVRIARRYGVPIVEDKFLAQGLGSLEAGNEIPESLYEAVAIVLSYVGRALALGGGSKGR